MQHIIISSFFLFTVLTCFKVIEACSKSKCGNNGPAIHIPYHRGHHCGQQNSECTAATDGGERQIVLVKFFVKYIDYIKQEVLVHNPENCLLLNVSDIPNTNMPASAFETLEPLRGNITLFRCPAETVVDADVTRAKLVPCFSDAEYRSYAILSDTEIGDVPGVEFCTKMYDVLSLAHNYAYYRQSPLRFKWSTPNCSKCEASGHKCRLKNNRMESKVECVPLRKLSLKSKLVATGSTLGTFVVLLLAIAIHRFYTWNRNETEHQFKVIRFLEDYKSLKPSRYSYADIKRITNEFKENLGEGSYGTVYKGSLSSEFFVAVKVLNDSKGNGEEFVNEVGAMGHIHHVNVVRMVGFCADGYRRALVYEYFPNSSLQGFISSADNKNCEWMVVGE